MNNEMNQNTPNEMPVVPQPDVQNVLPEAEKAPSIEPANIPEPPAPSVETPEIPANDTAPVTNTEVTQEAPRTLNDAIINTSQFDQLQSRVDAAISSMGPAVNVDALVDAYMGPKAQKFRTKRINVSAFFFNYLYLFFRKEFVPGLIYSIVTVAYLAYEMSRAEISTENGLYININTSLTLVFAAILALLFNKLYYRSVFHKVGKIQIDNPNASFPELKEICAKKGGTSIGMMILGMIIFGILFSAATYLVVWPKLKDGIENEQTEEVEEQQPVIDNSKFISESEDVLKGVQSQFMLDSVESISEEGYTYSFVNGVACGKSLEGITTNLDYMISVDKVGNVTSFYTTDGTSSIYYDGEGLKYDEIGSLVDNDSKVSITCEDNIPSAMRVSIR